MALLDPAPQATQAQPAQSNGLLDKLQGFLQNPSTMNLAMGLMAAGGYSKTPTTLGQAIAQGYSTGQDLDAKGLQNQTSKLQLTNEQIKLLQTQRQLVNQQRIANLAAGRPINEGITDGAGGAAAPANAAAPAAALTPAPSPAVAAPAPPAQTEMNPGALPGLGGGLLNQPAPTQNAQPTQASPAPQGGLLDGGNQVSDVQKQIGQAMIASGNLEDGLAMMGQGADYGQPVAAMDAKGNPVYIVTDKHGNQKILKGITPTPKDYTWKPSAAGGGLYWDPETGQIMNMPGTPQPPTLNAGSPGIAGNPGNSSAYGVPAVRTADGGFAVKNPLMSPGRGTMGATFIDPKTGRQISSDTARMATLDQTAIAGADRAIPQLQIMRNTLPQFQDAWTSGKANMEGIANNYFHANYALPTERAKGLSAQSGVLESIMKAFGLPTTDTGQEAAKKMITPQPGESPQMFQARLDAMVEHLNEFSQQAKQRLGQGTTLVPGNNQQAPQSANASALEAQAQAAIAAGADPAMVNARLKQMRGY